LGLRRVREDERIVDPAKTIDGSAATLLDAIRERLKLEAERDVSLKVLSPTAPQLRVLTERLQALDDQIAALNRSLTSETGAARTAADAMSRFEERELERRFAEKLLEISQSIYERARLEAGRQHLYLTTFVEPVRPDRAEYPKRVRTIALVAICASLIWGLTLLLVAAVNDHRLIS
jgi:capsular polysaccharide transport system permease protein